MCPAATAPLAGKYYRSILGIIVNQQHSTLSANRQQRCKDTPTTVTVFHKRLQKRIVDIKMYKIFRNMKPVKLRTFTAHCPFRAAIGVIDRHSPQVSKIGPGFSRKSLSASD